MNAKTSLLAVVIVCSLMAVFAVEAQSSVVIHGGKLCEKYLLKKVAKEKAEGGRVVRLKAFGRDNDSLPSDVEKWLEIANEETLAAHELRYGGKRVLLLNATHIPASGLATSFQYWFIKLSDQSVEFLSQAENPNLIFFDKVGSLNYYSVNFSDEFLMNKDWDNVTLKLLRYRVSSAGKAQLISKESNVKCE